MDLTQQVTRVRALAAAMRQAGCAIGSAELADALVAITLVAADREPQRLALRATLARDRQALAIFDQLFPWLFGAGAEIDKATALAPQVAGTAAGTALGAGADADGPAERVSIPAASSAGGSGRQAVPGARQGSDRTQGWAAPFLSWADRVGGLEATVGRRLDLRRTLQRSLTTAGEPVHLIWKKRPVRRQSLVLLDASRSMQQWAEQLVAVGRLLRRRRPDTEVYAFSAETSRLSDRLFQPDLSLPAASWGSGTRIADAIAAVLHGPHLPRRQHLSTLIVSDALEAAPAAQLAQALAALRLRSAVITWVNPLADSAGYRPLTQAAQCAFQAADRYQGLAALTRSARRKRP
ncbi:MAG: VWA domain-containing protein [Sulfobacillus sp.]